MSSRLTHDQIINTISYHLKKRANKHGFNLSDLVNEEDKKELHKRLKSIYSGYKNKQYPNPRDYYIEIINNIKEFVDTKIQLAL